MPASGFLQGLFLAEQLDAARENQRMALKANQELQESSQTFNRQENVANRELQLKNLMLQRQQFEADQAQRQVQNQMSLAQGFANGMFRSAQPTSVGTFQDIAPPPQVGLSSEVDANGVNRPAPAFDQTFASATLPAPEGTLFQINGQSVVVPSVQQRAEEARGIKRGDMINDIGLMQEKFTRLTNGLNLSPGELEDFRQTLFMGLPPQRATMENLLQNHLRRAYGTNDPTVKRQSLQNAREIQDILESLNRSKVSPRPAAAFDNTEAGRLAGRLMPQIFDIAQKLSPNTEPTPDVFKRAVNQFFASNPKDVPPQLRALVMQEFNRVFSRNIDPNTEQTIEGLIGQRPPIR